MEFEYAAEAEDELTISIGDVITDVVRSCDGWYEGKLNGKRGMFPDNFVKVRVFMPTISLSSECRQFNLMLSLHIWTIRYQVWASRPAAPKTQATTWTHGPSPGLTNEGDTCSRIWYQQLVQIS